MTQRRGAQWVAGAFLVLTLIAHAAAAPPIEGRYRIILMNGNAVYGDVTEQDDGTFVVANANGIKGVTIYVKKNEIRRVAPMEEAQTASETSKGQKPNSLRRVIADTEIEEILKGIEADVDPEVLGASREDLTADLDLDVESLREMYRQAALTWDESQPPDQQKNILVRPHFVVVYTAEKDTAMKLVARLESVWNWNVKFMKILDLPARRPEHKLELFYFGTYKEYEDHANRTGGGVSPGVLGYYQPRSNRSHFYDYAGLEGLRRYRELLTQPGTPLKQRREARNKIDRYVEHQNVEVIQHEAGHQIHFNIGLFPRNGLERESSIPIWLVEGTTQMFEVPPSRFGGSLGTLNDNRLDQVRKYWGKHPLSTAEWKLFLIDNNMWYTAMGRGGAGLSYPLGWSMVYYLYKNHQDEYAKYMKKVFGREPDFRMTPTEREAEFEEIFGTVDDDWVNRYYKFLDSLTVRPSNLPPEL